MSAALSQRFYIPLFPVMCMHAADGKMQKAASECPCTKVGWKNTIPQLIFLRFECTLFEAERRDASRLYIAFDLVVVGAALL